MAFHLATYQATVDGSGGFTRVNAVNDPGMTISNNGYLLPSDHQCLFAYAQGATMNRTRIVSPTLLSNYPPLIRPVTVGAVPPTDPNVAVFLDSPIRLPAGESVTVETVNGASEATYVALGITPQLQPAPRGEIKILRGTASTTLTANTYTLLSVTWDHSLQTGIYHVVGAEVTSTTAIFFRLLFTGQAMRPGAMGNATIGLRPHAIFQQRFVLGSWGSFRQDQMPQIEVMGTAGDTAETVHLYLVKAG